MLPTALFRRALAPFRVGSLTLAGRALTKHPEVVSLTKQTLRQAYSTDAAINRAAHDALKQMMLTALYHAGTAEVRGRHTVSSSWELRARCSGWCTGWCVHWVHWSIGESLL